MLASGNLEFGRVPTYVTFKNTSLYPNSVECWTLDFLLGIWILVYIREKIPAWPSPSKDLSTESLIILPSKTTFHMCYNLLLGELSMPIGRGLLIYCTWFPRTSAHVPFPLLFCFSSYHCNKSQINQLWVQLPWVLWVPLKTTEPEASLEDHDTTIIHFQKKEEWKGIFLFYLFFLIFHVYED